MAWSRSLEDIIEPGLRPRGEVWEIDEDAVTWEAGLIKPSGPNRRRTSRPMTCADVAETLLTIETGGRLRAMRNQRARRAPSFGVHVVDVEVDQGRQGRHPAVHRASGRRQASISLC